MKAQKGLSRDKYDCNLRTQKYTGVTNGLNLSRRGKKQSRILQQGNKRGQK